MGVGGFAGLRELSQRNHEPGRACRPFDQDRDGFIIGEGAGVIVLEELEVAAARGAKVYAEVLGYGMSADAFHITAPSEDGNGGVRVMKAALKRSGVSPTEVDYLNAHGTSTPHNDRIETLAIKQLFGEHARRMAISSTKSMTGHLLGAAGSLEAGITALAVYHQTVPPHQSGTPDPECDLDYVPWKCRPLKIRHALSNSFVRGTNARAPVQETRRVDTPILARRRWPECTMKIAVCIKRYPTREWQPRLDDARRWIRNRMRASR